MKTRITSIILAITLIFTVFSAITITASAEENVVYGDFMYTDLDDGTVRIDEYGGYDDDIVIPSTLKGKTVSAIGGNAFCGAVCNSIEIPASITLIESDAFYDFNDVAEFKVAADNEYYCAVGGVLFTKDMTQLVKYPATMNADSYEIPEGVEYVCDYAFQKSNLLETVIIPNTVETLGFSSFEQCENLASITIPESVKTVGYNAFCECTALTELKISDGVQSLEPYAFKDCEMLENVSIPDSVTSVGAGILDGTAYYNNEDNWENGLLYCGAYLLEADYSITDCVVKSGTRIIADSAFWYHDYLESITLPDTLQAIGDMSFISCMALKSVNIPNSVKTIGNVAFYGCTSLDEITIGSGVTHIGDSVFDITAYYSDINNWDNGALYIDGCLISSGLLALDESGRYYVNVTEVKGDYTVKPGTRLICDTVFNNRDKLASVTVPDSVKYIGDRAIGYRYTETGYEIQPDFYMICYAGTAAERYATDNGIDYTLLERPNGEYGDVNTDGNVNLLDLIAMRKHLAKWNVEIDKAAADCNVDGKVNLPDLILMRKYLAKWNVVLGLQG